MLPRTRITPPLQTTGSHRNTIIVLLMAALVGCNIAQANAMCHASAWQFASAVPSGDATLPTAELQEPEQEPQANAATEETAQRDPEPLPSIDEFTRKLERHEGFFTYYWDSRRGSIYLEIPGQAEEFLYVNGLATGLGSNPVGLDRGQLGAQRVVHFRRIGPKVLMVQRNLRFRARSDREPERRAVAESFAQSVIWSGNVVAEDEERGSLVDLTSLLLSDVHDVAGALKRAGQGEFSLAADRCVVFLPRCKAFPDNIEWESQLTWTSREPGRRVVQTAPTPQSMTLRQHHSFVRLPKPGYVPREFHPRAPSMSITFADYSAPIDQPLEVRWILRHRLEKSDPEAAVSEAVEPIVYYVDSGAPPPIREALIEGASWWNQAFEAAGFRNAFRVEVLPEGADPMDVRYNVIQWVHRRTRGWSYGGSVIDPRTGEILKGHVTLGSLRVRQDHLILSGLHSGGRGELGGCGVVGVPGEEALARVASGDDGDDLAVQVALARIRQLAAHEVGHTLGFVHNFAASTYDERASVMDYPAPQARVVDGRIDLSRAYAVGIGSWDKFAVRYAYTDFGDMSHANQRQALQELVDRTYAAGARFVTDADSRPPGAAHPWGNLWDNGDDPLRELEEVMRVRDTALEQLALPSLPASTDRADVEQYLVPLLLFHRYQVQAVGKLLGGVYYEYGTISQTHDVRSVPAAVQRSAMHQLLELLKPSRLALPERLRSAVGVRWHASQREIETFARRTGRVFDPVMAGQIAGDLVLDELLQPDRLTRMAQQTGNAPTARQLIAALIETSWERPAGDDPLLGDLSRSVRASLFHRLMKLVDQPGASVDVRGAALEGLGRFAALSLQDAEGWDESEGDFRLWLQREFNLYQNQSRPPRTEPAPTEPPPGSPIGN